MDHPNLVQDPGAERPAQVAVVGAGLMGHGIAQAFAQKDCTVALYDLDASILEKAWLRSGETSQSSGNRAWKGRSTSRRFYPGSGFRRTCRRP